MNFNKLLAISIIASLTSLSFASPENQLENEINNLEKKIDELMKINQETTRSNQEMHYLVKDLLKEHILTINGIIGLAVKELDQKGQENIDFLKKAGYALANCPDGVKRLVNLNDLKKINEFKLNKKFEDQKGKSEFIEALK